MSDKVVGTLDRIIAEGESEKEYLKGILYRLSVSRCEMWELFELGVCLVCGIASLIVVSCGVVLYCMGEIKYGYLGMIMGMIYLLTTIYSFFKFKELVWNNDKELFEGRIRLWGTKYEDIGESVKKKK